MLRIRDVVLFSWDYRAELDMYWTDFQGYSKQRVMLYMCVCPSEVALGVTA
jgi:hypothetical protein